MAEKAEYHPTSALQPIVDADMRLITERLKYLRKYFKQPK
jgi:hypothetical protein